MNGFNSATVKKLYEVIESTKGNIRNLFNQLCANSTCTVGGKIFLRSDDDINRYDDTSDSTVEKHCCNGTVKFTVHNYAHNAGDLEDILSGTNMVSLIKDSVNNIIYEFCNYLCYNVDCENYRCTFSNCTEGLQQQTLNQTLNCTDIQDSSNFVPYERFGISFVAGFAIGAIVISAASYAVYKFCKKDQAVLNQAEALPLNAQRHIDA